MKKLVKLPLLKLAAITGLILSILGYQQFAYAATSIHFSKYRFVFDDSHRKDSLVLSNTGLNAAICVLSIQDFIMSAEGPAKLAKSADEVDNSANKMIRFSPRRVTINPLNSQTVRITSRRRPNIEDGEFVSYFKMSCEEQLNPNARQTEQIAIRPKLIYYVPLQVRVGKLTASTDFEDIKLSATGGRYAVSFIQTREGERSIIGKLEVIEKKSGTVLGLVTNSVIYTPFNKKNFNIPLAAKPDGALQIVYTEDTGFQGTLSAQAEVK